MAMADYGVPTDPLSTHTLKYPALLHRGSSESPVLSHLYVAEDDLEHLVLIDAAMRSS